MADSWWQDAEHDSQRLNSSVAGLLVADQVSELSLFWQFSQIAGDLADGLIRSGGGQGFVFDDVVAQLVRVAVLISDAEVGTCRLISHDDYLYLCGKPFWPNGEPRDAKDRTCAVVPHRKDKNDCRPTLTHVAGGPRHPQLNDDAMSRGIYSDDELRHLDWLKSEAFIPLGVTDGMPKAIIVLGSSDPSHFSKPRLNLLQWNLGLLNAVFRLADLVQDRNDKARLLQNAARVLPRIAAADTEAEFQRATLALVTCGFGFGFDRAFFFRMFNSEFPADCRVAVGGTDDTWPSRRAKSTEGFASLDAFVNDAFENPVPKGDPLYPCACDDANRLMLHAGESPQIQAALEGSDESFVFRLSSSDPWIRKVQETRPGIFISRHDEYWVFPLKPFGTAEEGSPPVGFVIADLAYRPQRHTPGRESPDIVMTAFTLNLLAGMWRFRDRAQSYFHTLSALPLVRHSAPKLDMAVENLERSVARGLPLEKHTRALRKIADDVIEIRDIVHDVRQLDQRESVDDLERLLRDQCRESEQRHPIAPRCRIGKCEHAGPLRIRPDTLRSILTCLIDNAVVHGGRSRARMVTVNITVRLIDVPEPNGGRANRILIEVENDGRPIPPEIAPFLFVDRVSTNDGNGDGSGLSSARQMAKAHGGDVVLLSRGRRWALTKRARVRFGIVLKAEHSPAERMVESDLPLAEHPAR